MMFKKKLFAGLAALGVAAVGLSCGGERTANTAVSNTGANASPTHDMANMGHPMPSIDQSIALRTPDPSSEPFDLQFIDSMIYHHEAAVQMANMVLGKTERAEMKAFAQKVIDDQSREIAQMKAWRDAWYPGKPSALNMTMPGTHDEGMEIMQSEHLKEMDEMEANHFDNHFFNMMIPHHKGAIDMANDALKRAEHAEIMQLANSIIKAQTAEILQMRRWKATWKK